MFTFGLGKDGKQRQKSIVYLFFFSHVVSPQFVLQINELYVADTRGEDIELEYDKNNWYEYIEKLKPDIVIMLYKGVPNNTMLDFEGQIQ